MVDERPIELRTHALPQGGGGSGTPGAHDKRFDCFLIDTGWNEPVSKMVRLHLPMFFGAHNPDPLYILSPGQSVEIFRSEPKLIGNDPIVIVYDLYPPPRGKLRGKYKGFRLNLGLMRHPQQALARLQDFVRFLMIHRKSQTLEDDVLRELHREGFKGMVKVLHDVSEKTIELV